MLIGNAIRPVEYGGELPFELGWGAKMPDIVATNADDDEIVAGAADGLKRRQEISDSCAVLGSIMDRDLGDIVGELAGKRVLGPVGTGADGGAVAEDEYFFEREGVMHGEGSSAMGKGTVHAEVPEHLER